MVSIKDTEQVCIGHSANHIFHGLHGEMFAHDGTIEVSRIQAQSDVNISENNAITFVGTTVNGSIV